MTTPLSERMLEEAYVGGIAGWDDMIDEVASLEKRLEAAEKALREVERHHVELNGRAGRPESHSHTLGVVRAALAGEGKP